MHRGRDRARALDGTSRCHPAAPREAAVVNHRSQSARHARFLPPRESAVRETTRYSFTIHQMSRVCIFICIFDAISNVETSPLYHRYPLKFRLCATMTTGPPLKSPT